MIKNLTAVQEARIRSLDGEDPLEQETEALPVLPPGKSLDRGAWQAAVHGVAKSRA